MNFNLKNNGQRKTNNQQKKTMNKKEIQKTILKEKYRTLSILEDELPRGGSKSKVGIKIDKMMGEVLDELSKMRE